MRPTANAAKPGVYPRSSRKGIACTVMAIPVKVARKNAADSSQKPRDRNASPAGTESPAGSEAWAWSGARRTRACKGTVTTARMTARITSASRQPWASMRAWLSGRKMKLARAATKVTAVRARRRASALRNHFATTVKAGS